jgi:transcriptional regulator with XRE-family HTH domain
MDIGELLRHARRHARISQRELAGRTHIPRTTIGRIETGQLDPPLRMLGQLLAASGLRLRFGLEQLASGEPEQPDAELVNYLRRPLADRLEASLRSRGDAALAAGLADVGGDLLWQLVRTLGESPIPGYRVLIIGSAAEGCWHPGVATVIDPAQPVLALCPDQPRGLEMTAVLLEHLALEPPVGGVDGMCGQAAADLELQLATRLGLVRIDLRPASTTGYPDLVEAAVPVAVAGGWLVAELSAGIGGDAAAGDPNAWPDGAHGGRYGCGRVRGQPRFRRPASSATSGHRRVPAISRLHHASSLGASVLRPRG